MRLLGALYPRLSELDPKTPLRPRIDGILKHRWVLAQLKLNGACEAFDCLRTAGISFMVFKGGAFQAEGFSSANRRVLGDIDILVHPRNVLAALEALHREGWAAANGESLEVLRQLAAVRLNGNFRKGRHGNVDLHVSPFHYSRRGTALEDFWARARPAHLGASPILVPDPTDSVLIVLAHAADGTKGDWAVDVATRMREQDIDWDRLADMADSEGIVPACLAGLTYLSRRIGLSIPDHVLTRLSTDKVPVSQRLKYWSSAVDHADRGVAEKIAGRLADFMLDRQGFSREVKDRRAIAVSRSMIAPWTARRGRRHLAPAPGLDLKQSVQLPRLEGQTRLVLQLTFEEPVRSRRLFFDVCVDGVAVARLKTRAGGRTLPRMTTRRFRFHVPGSIGTLRISARPSHFLRPNATESEIADFGPFAFQVDGVWID